MGHLRKLLTYIVDINFAHKTKDESSFLHHLHSTLLFGKI